MKDLTNHNYAICRKFFLKILISVIKKKAKF